MACITPCSLVDCTLAAHVTEARFWKEWQLIICTIVQCVTVDILGNKIQLYLWENQKHTLAFLVASHCMPAKQDRGARQRSASPACCMQNPAGFIPPSSFGQFHSQFHLGTKLKDQYFQVSLLKRCFIINIPRMDLTSTKAVVLVLLGLIKLFSGLAPLLLTR